MHSNPLGPSEKIRFAENYKECEICAILREEKLILGHTQRQKEVLRVVRCAQKAPQRPKKMQIPRGYQKNVYCIESLRICW